MNINLHDAVWKRATYRERARTSCRRPTRYQWYLEERPARPLRFSSASNPLRLKLEQVDPGRSCGPNRRPRGGTGHYRPVICLSDCRSGEDQNNALKRYYACVILSLFFSGVVVAICLSGSSLFHDLRSLAVCNSRTGARESQVWRPRQPMTVRPAAVNLLSSAREHDL